MEVWGGVAPAQRALIASAMDLYCSSRSGACGAGDSCLEVASSSCARQAYGPGKWLFRLGGEEFAALIPGLDEDQLFNKLDDLRREVSVSQVNYEQQHINFTVSIGAVFSADTSLAQQMNDADGALYFAKENGRNQVAIAGQENEH